MRNAARLLPLHLLELQTLPCADRASLLSFVRRGLALIDASGYIYASDELQARIHNDPHDPHET